ncbi:hypothetical protein QE152_g6733 [Popillia japonica]|uniref:Uncharacterized protein n=1 Tax=Popillia japonica TaxID=7064 RepID=A0AAW1MI55_POPJA
MVNKVERLDHTETMAETKMPIVLLANIIGRRRRRPSPKEGKVLKQVDLLPLTGYCQVNPSSGNLIRGFTHHREQAIYGKSMLKKEGTAFGFEEQTMSRKSCEINLT